MPVFNERERLAETLASIASTCTDAVRIHVYVVDDGSSPPVDRLKLPVDTGVFRVTLARHLVNLGQGAALETARRVALELPSDVFVTMDSDGQHSPTDLPALCAAVVEGGADAVFGNRFRGDSNVPTVRRWVLRLASVFERVLTGLSLEDAHNGFRAFSPRAIAAMSMAQNRMAHATEIKQVVARWRPPLKIAEIPVSIRYSADSLAKGQSSLGAIQILFDLVYQFIFGESRSHR